MRDKTSGRKTNKKIEVIEVVQKEIFISIVVL